MGTRVWVSFAIIVLYHVRWLAQSTPYVIETAQGLIAGQMKSLHSGRQIFSFRGIPYAEAPIGELRFRGPAAKKPWNGTLNAFEYGNECIQSGANGSVIGDEDCLFLNVYAPQISADRQGSLPVMIYVHGGGLVEGSSNLLEPDYILSEDLILVTCNYRLGVFGFLSAGELSDLSGNYGLKDLLMMLRWTRENIRAFGGDPYSVTLVGHSAGALLVHYLALSDKSKPFFQKYVVQSAGVLGPTIFKGQSESKEQAKMLAEKHNCPTDSSMSLANCLRRLSPQQLQSKQMLPSNKIIAMMGIHWLPTIESESEDAMITRTPWELIRENKDKDAPLIMSVTSNEAMFFVTNIIRREGSINRVYDEIDEFIRDSLQLYNNAQISNVDELVKKIKGFYFDDEIMNDKKRFTDRFSLYFGDVQIVFPVFFTLQWRLRNAIHPYYSLLFDYRGTFTYTSPLSRSNEYIGCSHQDELIYLFPQDAHDFNMPESLRMTEKDYDMVDIMVDLWTSFAIDGRPVSRSLEKWDMWTPYSSKNSTLHLGNGSRVIAVLEDSLYPERMQFWQEHIQQSVFPLSNDANTKRLWMLGVICAISMCVCV